MNNSFKNLKDNNIIHEIRELKFKDGFYCPHCNNKHIVRYGKHKGMQRYKCKDCGKTFTEMSFTPLNKTYHADKWLKFIQCMIEGYCLRKSAEIVGVTWITLFYWRHKVLVALKQISIKHFEGLVEMNEIYQLYSEKSKKDIVDRGKFHKQVCVLVAKDREKNTVSKVACMGNIVENKVENTIGKYLSEDNILCTC
jgi:transposase-like protein